MIKNVSKQVIDIFLEQAKGRTSDVSVDTKSIASVWWQGLLKHVQTYCTISPSDPVGL